MSFWGELRRRNVVKAGIAYLVVAWLLAQVVGLVLPTFNAPEWVAQTIVFLLILGFPIVLIVAWAFEITPDGFKLTSSVPRSESITSITGQRLNYVVTALLAIAVVFLVLDNYVIDRAGEAVGSTSGGPGPEQSSVSATDSRENPPGDEIIPNSIAVLPLEDLSPGPDEENYAGGIHVEIINQLSKLKNLTVIGRDSVMPFAEGSTPLSEVAATLHVGSILTGSFQYFDGRIRIVLSLIDPQSGSTLLPLDYQESFADIFSVQADIAMRVANALNAEFSTAEQERIEALPTKSVEAYELYLAAQAYSLSGRLDMALQSIDSAVELDEDFALAWALKSQFHDLRSQGALLDNFAAEDEAMREAAFRAVEIAPNLAEAQAAFAFALGRQGRWEEAETAYRRAITLGNTASVAFPYSVFLLASGNFERALDLLESIRQSDPLNRNIRQFHLLALALTGRMEEADAEFDRASRLFGNTWLGQWFMILARLGGEKYRSLEAIPTFRPIHNEARQFLLSPREGLSALRRNYETNDAPRMSHYIEYAPWAAYFGDEQLALDAMEQIVSRNAQNAIFFWIPVMHNVRQEPRFKQMVKEAGLFDYWYRSAWPDICHPIGNDDFECD